MSGSCISTAAAATPGQAVSAHLWIDGLPRGQQVVVTVANHVQFNYVGGQGCCDFLITGQPGELIRVLIDDREVKSFTVDAGASVYLNLMYTDGVVSAGPNDPNVPVPTLYSTSAVDPEPGTEHTGIGMFNSMIFVVALVMCPIVVSFYAITRPRSP